MTKIVQKRLPNAISVADVTDATVRQKLMLAIQNIAVLMSQLSEAQKAIVELQRNGSSSKVNTASIATEVAPLVENIVVTESKTASAAAAAASGSAAMASSASDTAVSAKDDAVSAKNLAVPAATDAVNAKIAAESARDVAKEAAQSVSWSTAISFVNQAISSERTILMDGIVPDTSKTYSVKVLFRNTSSTSRACKVNGEVYRVEASVGATNSKTLTGVPGSGSFTFANVANTVDVFIFIKKEL
nr:MAG TPA: transmembrane protein [Caudoviricetes sp.]